MGIWRVPISLTDLSDRIVVPQLRTMMDKSFCYRGRATCCLGKKKPIGEKTSSIYMCEVWLWWVYVLLQRLWWLKLCLVDWWLCVCVCCIHALWVRLVLKVPGWCFNASMNDMLAPLKLPFAAHNVASDQGHVWNKKVEKHVSLNTFQYFPKSSNSCQEISWNWCMVLPATCDP